MFDRLLGGRPELNIQLETPHVHPGEEVRGVVHLQASSERGVEQGMVSLRCEEEYVYRERRRRSGSRSGSEVVSDREKTLLVDESQVFLDKTVVLPGQGSEFPFSFRVPEGAPPTYEGDILKLRWYVHAKLDLDRSLDATADASVSVYLPPEGPYPQPRYEATTASHEVCDLAMQLDGEVFAAGGAVSGVLHVQPKVELEVQGIRVELARVEWVPMKQGNTDETHIRSVRLLDRLRLPGGVPVDLPFRIDIPAALHPSAYTAHGAAYWELDAIVARSWKGDLHLRKGIHVYTAPPSG